MFVAFFKSNECWVCRDFGELAAHRRAHRCGDCACNTGHALSCACFALGTGSSKSGRSEETNPMLAGAADLYSLGVVAFELWHPFTTGAHVTAHRVRIRVKIRVFPHMSAATLPTSARARDCRHGARGAAGGPAGHRGAACGLGGVAPAGAPRDMCTALRPWLSPYCQGPAAPALASAAKWVCASQARPCWELLDSIWCKGWGCPTALPYP